MRSSALWALAFGVYALICMALSLIFLDIWFLVFFLVNTVLSGYYLLKWQHYHAKEDDND